MLDFVSHLHCSLHRVSQFSPVSMSSFSPCGFNPGPTNGYLAQTLYFFPGHYFFDCPGYSIPLSILLDSSCTLVIHEDRASCWFSQYETLSQHLISPLNLTTQSHHISNLRTQSLPHPPSILLKNQTRKYSPISSRHLVLHLLPSSLFLAA